MKQTRKPISKRVRFAVFERDKFTCQYCGKIPPEVTLELDHIVPHSKGGTDEDVNLTTSCRDCNAGKSDLEIGRFAPSTDAFSERCRLEQERLEVEAYLKEAEQSQAARSRLVKHLQDYWVSIFSAEYCPKENVMLRWIKIYPPELIKEGIDACGLAVARGALKHPDQEWAFDHALKYAGACMRNKAAEDAEAVNA